MAKRRTKSGTLASEASIDFPVKEPPKFDLQSYISNYEGRTRLDRLLTIGRQSSYLSRDALNIAVQEAKRGKDVNRYLDTVSLYQTIWPDVLSGEDGHRVEVDKDWVDQRSRQVKVEGDRLESELKGYKNNLIKESIRMGTEDLATHFHLTGDLVNSQRHYMRMREYCTTPKHIAEMHLKVCLVAAAQEQWLSVQQSCNRVQAAFSSHSSSSGGTAAALAKGASSSQPGASQSTGQATTADSSTEPKQPTQRAAYELPLPPLLGLASMASGDLYNAATHFLRTSPDYISMHESPFSAPSTATSLSAGSPPSTSSTVIGGVPPINRLLLSPSDIATYATLCALCTFSRSELSQHLLSNTNFRPFLDEEPHLRRAVASFVAGKYANLLEILEQYRGDWMCDLFLSGSAPADANTSTNAPTTVSPPTITTIGFTVPTAPPTAATTTSPTQAAPPTISSPPPPSGPHTSSTQPPAPLTKPPHTPLDTRLSAMLTTIHSRCITQHASVFSRVSIRDLRLALTPPSSTTATTDDPDADPESDTVLDDRLTTTLTSLITSSALPSFRLDLQDRSLVATRRDERAAALRRAVDVARDREEDMRLRLWRVAMKGAGLVVPGGSGSGSGSGGSGLGMGAGTGGRLVEG